MLRRLLLLSAILLTGQITFAWSGKAPLIDPRLYTQTEDFKSFKADAAELLNLYRGAAPIQYRFHYTGTYFAYQDEYVKGNIIYNGKLYSDVLLNLNCHSDDLQVKIEKSDLIVILNKDFVNSFSIGNHYYINIGRRATGNVYLPGSNEDERMEGVERGFIDESLPAGYYEVMYDGEMKLLKKTKKTYGERINQSAGTDPKSAIERSFSTTYSYYLVTEARERIGKGANASYITKPMLKSIKRRSSLIASLPERRGEVRGYLRRINIDYMNRDLVYPTILRYYEGKITNTNN